MLAAIAVLGCLGLVPAQASERAGIDQQSVRRVAAQVEESSFDVEVLTSSAGSAERAQSFKLRRHSVRSTKAPAASQPAKRAKSDSAKRSTKSEPAKSPVKTEAAKKSVAAKPIAKMNALRPAKSNVAANASKPTAAAPSSTKPAAQKSATVKKDVAKSNPAKPKAEDVRQVVASTKRSSSPEKSKIVPAVKYESVKKASGHAAKPVVDVFSDPFGDAAATAAQPSAKRSASASTRRAVKAIEDDVNPFADDDPLERLVKRQVQEDSDTPRVPLIEEDLAQGAQPRLAPCPSPDTLKRIREIKADISSDSTDLPPECTLGNIPFEPRQFAPTMYHWKASALCHKPLYFEDVSLERYGHSWGPILQPLVSGAEFFVTLPVLPYKMGIEPPCECVYVLGYYRPGSCAPYMIFPVPLSIRGGLVEAGAVVGAVFIIP